MKKKMIMFAIVVIAVLLSGCIMGEERYEYYNTGADGYVNTYNVIKIGQTFTIGTVGDNVSFNPTKARIQLEGHASSNPTGFRCYIVETTSGKPRSDWQTNYIAYTSMTVDTAYTGWLDIDLNASSTLKAGTMYALVAFFDTSISPRWWYDGSSPTYTGGTGLSENIGTWTILSARDFMFEIWGQPVDGMFKFKVEVVR